MLRPARGPFGFPRAFLLLALVAAGLPATASAQVTWLVPSGGETWTAGTQHTIAWSGGSATVFGIAALPVPPTSIYPIQGNFPNTGYVTWYIPPTLPPGTYTINIGFVGDQSGYDGPQFTIVAPPECLPSCQTVSFSMDPSSPNFGIPPSGVCGTSAHQAGAFAESYAQAQLAGQCFEGYALDPGSVVLDVTVIPFGVCLAGYTGAFVAEASGFGCCCPGPVPVTPSTWGVLKSRFR
jgi:hypothetical protein